MKKISNLLMMALLTIGMGLTSCDEQLDNAVTPVVAEVTSIEVDLSKIDEKYLDTEKTKLQLTVGDEVELSFTILPEEVADTEVELTADDATILSIDGLKVKALKEGETKVTAKAGDKTAECTITVKAATVAVTSVTLDKTELALTVGDAAVQLTATVAPDNASVKSVTWTSDKTSVATVDETGKVTAVAAGTATITAFANDESGKSATCTVTVAKPSPFASVTAADLGKIIGNDSKIYADKSAAEAAGATAVAMIAYVGSNAETSTTYNHGLALALEDVSGTKAWCSQTSVTCLGTQYDGGSTIDLAGIANTDALVNHTGHTHAAASAARDYNSGTHPAGTSAWFLPSAFQWDKMANAAGGYANLKTNAGLQSDYYWSSTEYNATRAWNFDSGSGNWTVDAKSYNDRVRACLAF